MNKNYELNGACIYWGNSNGERYQKRVMWVDIGSLHVIFIPNYNTKKFPFLPLNTQLDYRGPQFEKNEYGDKKRIELFREADIVFFEDDNRKGELHKLNWSYNNEASTTHKLVFCIDSKTYEWIRKSLKKDFYEFTLEQAKERRGLYGWKKEYLLNNQAFQYIDEKMKEWDKSNLLTDDMYFSLNRSSLAI